MSELDQLIDAHLDGLREGGGAGVEQARSAYQTGIERRAPDVSADGFVVLALALLSDDTQTMHTAVSEGVAKPGFADALSGAFSWCMSAAVSRFVEAQLSHPEPALRDAALMQSHIHVATDSAALKKALLESPQASMTVALDAVANCGRIDLLPLILDVLKTVHPNEEILFSAAQCALLLGERRQSAPVLQNISLSESPHATDAMKLLCLALPPMDLQGHLQHAESQSVPPSLMIEAAGWSGNPACVAWLIAQMDDTENASLAGEAFCRITGFDAISHDASLNPSDARGGFKSPYPIPDAAKIDQWWQKNLQHYSSNNKYFLGRPLSLEWLKHILLHSGQAQRELASLHRMLSKPGTRRFPTRANAAIQFRHLQNFKGSP